jgi:hypothetical protein
MGRALLISVLALGALAACAAPASAYHGARPVVPGGTQEGVQRYDVAQASSSFQATAGPVGDVNGDGVEDLAAVSGTHGDMRVEIRFGRRPGASGAPVAGFDIIAPSASFAITGAGDTNADGLGDVAVATWEGLLVVYGKRGGAAVRADELGTQGFMAGGASSIAHGYGSDGLWENAGITPAGDQNGDGRGDLALSEYHRGVILLSPRTAGGEATFGASVSFASVSGTFRATDDLDGDGRRDLLVTRHDPEAGGSVFGIRAPAGQEEIRARRRGRGRTRVEAVRVVGRLSGPRRDDAPPHRLAVPGDRRRDRLPGARPRCAGARLLALPHGVRGVLGDGRHDRTRSTTSTGTDAPSWPKGPASRSPTPTVPTRRAVTRRLLRAGPRLRAHGHRRHHTDADGDGRSELLLTHSRHGSAFDVHRLRLVVHHSRAVPTRHTPWAQPEWQQPEYSIWSPMPPPSGGAWPAPPPTLTSRVGGLPGELSAAPALRRRGGPAGHPQLQGPVGDGDRHRTGVARPAGPRSSSRGPGVRATSRTSGSGFRSGGPSARRSSGRAGCG